MDKLKELFTPINILRLLAAFTGLAISIYSIGKGHTISEATRNQLNFLTQLLLILFFVVSGVEGLKDKNKTKRYLSYFYFCVATVMAIINVLIIV